MMKWKVMNPSLNRIGVYPGTFDPITLGHIDIIERALPLVDQLIIAVAENESKKPLFSLKDRLEMIDYDIKTLMPSAATKVAVKSFDNLLVDFAKAQNAQVIIRGLRAVSDFEYEFQMAGVNRKLCPQIETVFLMASEQYQLISSRFVKDIARFQRDMTSFVSDNVSQKMQQHFSQTSKQP